MFGMIGRFLPYRRPVIVGAHLALVTVAYFLAFLLRFEFHLPASEWERFLRTLPLLLLARMAVFAWFHLYEGLWRYVSMRDILAILKAVTLSSLIFMAGVLAFSATAFPDRSSSSTGCCAWPWLAGCAWPSGPFGNRVEGMGRARGSGPLSSALGMQARCSSGR
jgi:hypothetical protein